MTLGSAVAQWWRDRAIWEQALIIVVPGVSLGVGVGALVAQRRPELPGGGYTPATDLPDLLDFDEDSVDEQEPPEIQYDPNDAPCIEKPVPVAAGLEGEEYCTPPKDLEPKVRTSVEFAGGGDRPRWPIETAETRKIQVSYQDVRELWHGRWGRHFGASRKSKGGGKRHHAGVDLFGDPGDVVLAMEPGEILATLPFYKGTSAVYLLTDSGLIINYGELEPKSWGSYGIKTGIETGQRVKAGDRLGRVGLSNDGSHMLHLETYDPSVALDQIRRGDMQWKHGQEPPTGLLDPTRYLVRAQRVKHERMVEDT